MRVAKRAEDFGAAHAVAGVGMADDVFFGDRLEEAGPTGAGIEFGFRRKQGQTTTDADVNAGFMVVVKRAAKSWFGPFAASDAVLFWRQLLFPFFVAFNYFGNGSDRADLAFVVEKSYLDHSLFIRFGVCRICGERLHDAGD